MLHTEHFGVRVKTHLVWHEYDGESHLLSSTDNSDLSKWNAVKKENKKKKPNSERAHTEERMGAGRQNRRTNSYLGRILPI